MAAAAGRSCHAAARVVVALALKKIVVFFWAPRAGKESSRRAAAFFSFAAPRPSRGRKHASPPSHCAASPHREKGATRERVFFVKACAEGLVAFRPMPGGFFFFSFFIKAAPAR